MCVEGILRVGGAYQEKDDFALMDSGDGVVRAGISFLPARDDFGVRVVC